MSQWIMKHGGGNAALESLLIKPAASYGKTLKSAKAQISKASFMEKEKDTINDNGKNEIDGDEIRKNLKELEDAVGEGILDGQRLSDLL